MHILKNIDQLRKYLTSHRLPGSRLGFVPTMGALHEGHLSLVRESVKHNDITLSSIFVNPTQFNNKNDLLHYPKTLEDDLLMLKNEGCSAVFLPDNDIMYPSEPVIGFDIGYLDEILEGAFRKGHFNGVLLIVAKFFNLIKPDLAYFGQKDLQQYVVLKTMVDELFFDLQMVMMPIVRENDGLAMSSRNRRLDEKLRANATSFYKALNLAKHNLEEGLAITETKKLVEAYFENREGVSLEYFDIVDSNTLLQVDKISTTTSTALCIAGYVGEIRLIDNIIIV